MSKKTESLVDAIIEDIVEDNLGEIEDDAAEIDPSSDPKWVDFVLDKLANHELVKGAPTTDGLRRVTELIFGEILQSDTDIVDVKDNKIVAKHTLVIQKYSNGTQIVVSACVDVLSSKLPAPFDSHLTSTACTRAEGKALRRALKIRVHTAEELTNVEEIDKTGQEEISDQQISALNCMCKRCNIDAIKFIKANIIDNRTIKKVGQLNKTEGRVMMDKLSSYQRDGTPDDLAGYKDNWLEKFGG